MGGDQLKKMLVESRPLHAEGGEKFPVNGFDDVDGLGGEGAAFFGNGERFGTGVGGVRIPQKQAFFFEGAEDVGGHHHVHFRVGGKFHLGEGMIIARKPGEGGKENKLGMSETKRT